jgi:hypothetical protein
VTEDAAHVKADVLPKEIDSHQIVTFGQDSDFEMFIFGGFINNNISSSSMFRLYPK